MTIFKLFHSKLDKAVFMLDSDIKIFQEFQARGELTQEQERLLEKMQNLRDVHRSGKITDKAFIYVMSKRGGA